jgi:hypothetical protein
VRTEIQDVTLFCSKSMTFNREQLDERSQRTSKMLVEVQQQAVLLGNKMQLEHMKQRLNASEASNDHQETSGGGTKHMAHVYSTSEPSVIIVPDAETGELLENSKCFVPTLTYQGETLHNFEMHNGDTTDESKLDMLTLPSTLEGERTDMSSSKSVGGVALPISYQ